MLATAPSSERTRAAILVSPAADARTRLQEIFEAHFDRVWRTLRRCGLPPEAADDAAQQVFLVADRRLSEIEKDKELPFLLGTATRVACEVRAKRARQRELSLGDALEEWQSSTPQPDELT